MTGRCLRPAVQVFAVGCQVVAACLDRPGQPAWFGASNPGIDGLGGGASSAGDGCNLLAVNEARAKPRSVSSPVSSSARSPFVIAVWVVVIYRRAVSRMRRASRTTSARGTGNLVACMAKALVAASWLSIGRDLPWPKAARARPTPSLRVPSSADHDLRPEQLVRDPIKCLVGVGNIMGNGHGGRHHFVGGEHHQGVLCLDAWHLLRQRRRWWQEQAWRTSFPTWTSSEQPATAHQTPLGIGCGPAATQ